MHGFAASAENLLFLVSQLDARAQYNWILPLAPIPLKDPMNDAFLGYAWFPRERRLQIEALSGNYFRNMEEIDGGELQEHAHAIEKLRQILDIPHHSLVVGGFSQGAIMTAEFLMQSARPCAGALLFSGTLVAKERWTRSDSGANSTPFLQTHGRADDILSFDGAHALYQLLSAKGFTGQLHAFDGGHVVSQQGLSDASAALSRWLG